MSGAGKVLAALALAGLTMGCYEHTFHTGTGAPQGPVVYDDWHNHWLGGLIGEEELDIDALCPSGNATIHDEQTFLNGLVSALTSGIYAPTTVTVRCARGRTADVELSEATVIGIVDHPAFLQRVDRLLPERASAAGAALGASVARP